MLSRVVNSKMKIKITKAQDSQPSLHDIWFSKYAFLCNILIV